MLALFGAEPARGHHHGHGRDHLAQSGRATGEPTAQSADVEPLHVVGHALARDLVELLREGLRVGDRVRRQLAGAGRARIAARSSAGLKAAKILP